MTAAAREAMKVRAFLPAFVCGVATILLTYALFAEVQAQPESGALVACADAQGQLRMPDPPGACASSETLVPLKPMGGQSNEQPQADPTVADLEQRLRELEARLKDGDARMLDNKVAAPFEVVNEAGIKIFSVVEESLGDRTVNVFNNAGKHVAWIYGSDERGWMRTMSATSDLYAEITPDGLIVRNHDLTTPRVELGRIKDTRHGLRFLNVNGKMVAGIGQSTSESAESGVAVVADALGQPRIRMFMASPAANVGAVDILNAAGAQIGLLSVDARQNGLLQLRNDAGVLMVEAGTVGGVGVVRAGPGAFQHAATGMLGLPASYIQGKPQ